MKPGFGTNENPLRGDAENAESKSPFAAHKVEAAPVVPAASPSPEALRPPDSSPQPPASPIVWQPFTFSGVASFTGATLSRLFLVELIIALIVGASVVWFADRNYSPVIAQAITQLPDETTVRKGQLEGISSQLLADRKFLSIAIDLEQNGDIGQSGDLQVEFYKSGFRVCSMFRSVAGVLAFDYPKKSELSLGRSTLEPWWGAWHPVIYVGILGIVVSFLFVIWAVLATIYVGPAKLVAYYADRDLTAGQCWLLASAALMPGALVMVLGIVLYGCQVLDLISLGVFVAAHLLVGWIYLLASPCRVRRNIPEKVNPFNS
jgi:hypothetical protein